VVQTLRTELLNGVSVHFGSVQVSNQVVSYQRRRFSGEILDETPLDMPVSELVTKAVWYTLDELLVADTGLELVDLPGRPARRRARRHRPPAAVRDL